MKDFLNQEITSGDLIVYPGRQGSALWMNRAIVLGFTPKGGIRVKLSDGTTKTITRIDRVVVVHTVRSEEHATI